MFGREFESLRLHYPKAIPSLGGMAFAFYQDNHFKNFYMHSLDDFISAREHLAQVLLSTKLIYSPIFSEESGNKVFIKPENLQKTGSFKIRGGL